jgi:DNA-binding response OmpR family regulator
MNAKKGVILLIEDEAGFRRTYRDVLERDGYDVLEAEDGERGWELLKEQKPTLVLLDLILPKLDGFEILKRLRADAETKAIPVIIFSVLGEPDDIKKGLALGANDYTVKGFYSPMEILSKIHAILSATDIKQHLGSYKMELQDHRLDAAHLQQDVGLVKGFECPHCAKGMVLELIPDYTRTDGHWFTSHFVCPNCGREF